MKTSSDGARFTQIARRSGARAAGIGVVLLLTGASVPALGRVNKRKEPREETVTLKLVEQSTHVVIEDQLATTQARLLVQSPTNYKHAVDGVGDVAVGPGAHATAFAYWNGQERVDGEIVERAKSAMRRDSGILEEHHDGLLSYRIFPFQGDETKRVDIRYERWLERRGAAVEYRAPRIVGAVDFVVRDRRGVRGITSSSHAIEATKDGESWRVRVLSPSESPKELVLRYETSEPPWTLTAWTHTEQGQDAWVAATLNVPARVPELLAREVTILLDRSPTMKEPRLALARAAAERVLGGLAPTDALNVITFDRGLASLYRSARPASGSALSEALAFMRGVTPGKGIGLKDALERAMSLPRDPARMHQIVLITDAESIPGGYPLEPSATRPGQLIDVVLVGTPRSRYLVEKLAPMSGGRATFLPDDSAVLALPEGWLGARALTELSLEAEGAEVRHVQPARIPDAYPGEYVQVAARVRGQGQVRLHLRARGGTKAVDHVTTIDLGAEARPWVRAAWTYARISGIHTHRFHGPDKALREEVVDLALAAGCTSPLTAFLAIPEGALNPQAEAELAKGRGRRRVALWESLWRGPPELPPPPMPPLISYPARPESAGCASCEVRGSARGHTGVLGGVGLLAAASLRRRGRRRLGRTESPSEERA